jgi:GT2 family glycosyltransferase
VQTDLDLSIVIVNWNSQQLTSSCIDSIVRHLNGVTYEIILVDNGSSDKSVEYFGADQRVTLVANASNIGFAKANNIGIRLANGKVILLLNNDTIILDDSIQNSLQLLIDSPSVGMIGCKLLNADGTLQRSCSRFPNALTSLIGRQVVARALKRIHLPPELAFGAAFSDGDHLGALSPDWIMGAFMMVKREAINDAGMLDEDYFMYSEDMDWCYRLRRAGWDIAYLPAASIIHLGGQSSRAVPEATLRRQLASYVVFYRKHHPKQLRLAIAIQYLSLLVELLVRFVITPFSGLRNREERRNASLKLRLFRDEIEHAMGQPLTEAPRLPRKATGS